VKTHTNLARHHLPCVLFLPVSGAFSTLPRLQLEDELEDAQATQMVLRREDRFAGRVSGHERCSRALDSWESFSSSLQSAALAERRRCESRDQQPPLLDEQLR